MHSSSPEAVCLYSELDNGIHQIVLTESSRQAVDGWIAAVEHIYENAQPNDLVRMLADLRCGAQPFAYTMLRMRDLLKKYPQRPRARTAFYHDPDFLAFIVRDLVTATIKTSIGSGRDAVDFFPSDQYDKAIQWLLLD